MSAVIARFSGIATFGDGNEQQFAAHLDERGNISVNNSSESAEAIAQVQADQDWVED